MNPVDWITDMYSPGAHVILKLDIDDDEVEGALVEQMTNPIIVVPRSLREN